MSKFIQLECNFIQKGSTLHLHKIAFLIHYEELLMYK